MDCESVSPSTFQFSEYNPVRVDVASLFTNDQFDLTFNVLEHYIQNHNINLTISFSTIYKLINLTLNQAYFKFHKFFKQNSGLSMGSR